MNIKQTITIATLGLATLATTGQAIAADLIPGRHDFVVTVDEKMTSDDMALRKALGLIRIDCFKARGQFHYVISAKSEGYIGAYLYAKGVTPAKVSSLPVRWNGTEFTGLSDETRLNYRSEIEVF